MWPSRNSKRRKSNTPKARYEVTVPDGWGGGVELPSEVTDGDAAGTTWAAGSTVTRETALAVPAVLRARQLVCVTPATLPLVQYGGANRRVENDFVSQPEEGVPATVTYSSTYEDMWLSQYAVWRITERGRAGYPARARYIEVGRTAIRNGEMYIDSKYVPSDEVIVFPGALPPLLRYGARAIRTLYLLDGMAEVTANGGVLQQYFTPKDPDFEYFDEDAEEGSSRNVLTFLAAWRRNRQLRSIGFVPGALDLRTVSINSKDLQLAEARQHAVLELSRLTGVDAEYLGVSTTSRTYQNNVDRRRDLLTFTSSGLYAPLEQRLSMPDITPPGNTVRLYLDEFLRADPFTRAQAAQIAGGGVAWKTRDELRAEENLPPDES